jgi:hypothetical protein
MCTHNSSPLHTFFEIPNIDGRRYRGEWRNGMAHGHGTETYPNGSIRHEGEWMDDEPVR